MNWIIHFLVSNIITIAIKNTNRKYTDGIIYFLSFISHIPLDVMDKLTYHPEFEQAWTDPFYIVWSIIVLAAAFYVLKVSVKFQTETSRKRFYIVGLFFSVIIDLWDWITLRIIAFCIGVEFWSVYKLLGLHRMCEYVNVLKSAPSFRDNKFAIIAEILLIWLLWKLWRKMETNFISNANRHQSERNTDDTQLVEIQEKRV